MKPATVRTVKANLKIYLDILLLFIGLVSGISFILLIGFDLSRLEILLIQRIIDIVIYCFIFEEFFRLFTFQRFWDELRSRWIEFSLVLLLIFEILFKSTLIQTFRLYFPFVSFDEIAIAYLVVSQLNIFLIGVFKIVRHSSFITRLKVPPGAIFAMSFAILILLGSFFLSLPKASATGNSIKYIDALFTSTSAVCVTGLIVLDTPKDFSFLGQIIILILIQLGGLGIMTLTTFFFTFVGGGVSLRMRLLLKEFLSTETFSAIASILRKIVFYTFTIELIGFLVLYLSMAGFNKFDGNTFYIAIFHSISAFCNAGFSLFSENLATPLLRTNYIFKFTVTLLIIFGGLGFLTLAEIFSLKIFGKRVPRIRFQLSVTSKIVLVTTLILIVLGSGLIFLADFRTGVLGNNTFDTIFNAYFQSVTARTAGFNTVPIENLSVLSAIVLIFLMWVGASPGGTGGGIKTTTFAVVFIFILNYIRSRERLIIFDREIAHETIQKAFVILILSIFVIFVATSVLIYFEPKINPLNLLFEVTSAFGTVGLSRNVTFHICDSSKLVLVFVMFIGRIGVLTFFTAVFKPFREYNYTLPKVNVNVG